MAVSLSSASTGSMASALATTIGSGATIKIYTGGKPATPETAPTGTLLVTIPISGAFTAAGNVITAADPASAAPAAAGTAGYFRLATSGGTAILDGEVGTTGGVEKDLNLGNTSIQTGVNVDLGAPSITVPVA